MRAPVVRRQARRAATVAQLLSARVVSLRGELAVLGVHAQVAAAARVKAEDELAIALAEGVRDLVAVAPLLDGGLDRLELEALQASQPDQGVLPLGLLVAELLLVR